MKDVFKNILHCFVYKYFLLQRMLDAMPSYLAVGVGRSKVINFVKINVCRALASNYRSDRIELKAKAIKSIALMALALFKRWLRIARARKIISYSRGFHRNPLVDVLSRRFQKTR